MTTIQGRILEAVEHSVRRGFRSDVNAKLDTIIKLVDELNSELSTEIQFINSPSNHYALVYKNERFEFNTYDSLINALTLINKLRKDF